MKKNLLISFAVIFAALITNNSIKSYPYYGNVYVHPITGHKVGLLGDRHAKINKIFQEANFLNAFMPFLKYILSAKDSNLKFVMESNCGKEFSEEFYKKNEKLGYLDLYDKFNNRQGMSLVADLCFTENRGYSSHLYNYLGLGDLQIKNEAIEADLRKSTIFFLADIIVRLAENKECFDDEMFNSNPKFLISWSKALMSDFISLNFDLPFDIENLLKNLSELINQFKYNAVHSKDSNESKIWRTFEQVFEDTAVYINEIIKDFSQVNQEYRSLIKEQFGIDENTPLNEIPVVLIFVIPRLLNNLNLKKETEFKYAITILTTDAGFLKEICNQARLNNNCLLLAGALHCIGLENWLLKLGYIKLYNHRSILKQNEDQKIYSLIVENYKEKYDSCYYPYIGNEALQKIMSELLGKEKAAELSTMKSDILQYHSSMIPHLKARDNFNNILGLLAGAGIGLAATFGLGKILGSFR